MEERDEKTRRFLRFFPDQGQFAQIDPKENQGLDAFDPTIVALIVDESQNGCGLILLDRDLANIPEKVIVQVGRLSPIYAFVRYKNEIDTGVFKVGIEYAT